MTDDEGNEYKEKEALEGCHADVRTKLQSHIDALSDITVTVDSPLHKFLGE